MRRLYSVSDSQTAYPIGYAATRAMTTMAGERSSAASRRSSLP